MNWITFALGCQNMGRVVASVFVRMFGLVSEKLYDSKEEQQKLLDGHTQFSDTEGAFGSIISGVILGMEGKRAEGEGIPDELIRSTKTTLMGPSVGMGGSSIGGTLRPILHSITMKLSASIGSIAGPLFYCAAWLGIIIPGTQLLFSRGYKLGINAVDVLFVGGHKDIITGVANIAGLTVVGAIPVQYINAVSGWSHRSRDTLFSLQGILDSIMSELFSLGLTLSARILLDKKNIKIATIFIIFTLIAIVGGLGELLIVA